MDQQSVGQDRDATGRQAAVGSGRRGARPTTDGAPDPSLRSVVGHAGPPAQRRGEVRAEPGRLPSERAAHLGALQRSREGLAERLAPNDPIGQRLRQPAGDRVGQPPLELGAGQRPLQCLPEAQALGGGPSRRGRHCLEPLGEHPLDHLVLDERLRDRLRQGTGQHGVDCPFGLGGERRAAGARRGACRPQGHAAEPCGDPLRLAVLVAHCVSRGRTLRRATRRATTVTR